MKKPHTTWTIFRKKMKFLEMASTLQTEYKFLHWRIHLLAINLQNFNFPNVFFFLETLLIAQIYWFFSHLLHEFESCKFLNTSGQFVDFFPIYLISVLLCIAYVWKLQHFKHRRTSIVFQKQTEVKRAWKPPSTVKLWKKKNLWTHFWTH